MVCGDLPKRIIPTSDVLGSGLALVSVSVLLANRLSLRQVHKEYSPWPGHRFAHVGHNLQPGGRRVFVRRPGTATSTRPTAVAASSSLRGGLDLVGALCSKAPFQYKGGAMKAPTPRWAGGEVTFAGAAGL